MGSITPTPTAENRAAFTLAVVQKVAPTAAKWAAQRVHQSHYGGTLMSLATAVQRAAFTLAVV